MALWCRLFMRVLILVFGIFRLVNFLMECSCMAPLTHAMMVMRGLVFHPLFCIELISGSYMVCFCVMVCYGNMSSQCVNSMSWNVVVGDGIIGVCVWFGDPIMHRMFCLSLAWHRLAVCGHAHLNN